MLNATTLAAERQPTQFKHKQTRILFLLLVLSQCFQRSLCSSAKAIFIARSRLEA